MVCTQPGVTDCKWWAMCAVLFLSTFHPSCLKYGHQTCHVSSVLQCRCNLCPTELQLMILAGLRVCTSPHACRSPVSFNCGSSKLMTLSMIGPIAFMTVPCCGGLLQPHGADACVWCKGMMQHVMCLFSFESSRVSSSAHLELHD